jgi:predicted permease
VGRGFWQFLTPSVFFNNFKKKSMEGKKNIAIGFITMGVFMIYGFILIYLRDFAEGKEEWIANYSIGKHFETRLAHVHGNLFAFLNILIGYLLLRFKSDLRHRKAISALALSGLLMPIGILLEVYFGVPPALVLIGAIAMTTSVFWLGFSFYTMKNIDLK